MCFFFVFVFVFVFFFVVFVFLFVFVFVLFCFSQKLGNSVYHRAYPKWKHDLSVSFFFFFFFFSEFLSAIESV